MTEKQLEEIENNFDKGAWYGAWIEFSETLSNIFGRNDAALITQIIEEDPENPKINSLISVFKKNYGQPDLYTQLDKASQSLYGVAA